MSIPGAASPLFLTSAAADAAAYQIDRSLRFNDNDSAYFNKTTVCCRQPKKMDLERWLKDAFCYQTIFFAGFNMFSEPILSPLKVQQMTSLRLITSGSGLINK